jgi:hypothetical protein
MPLVVIRACVIGSNDSDYPNHHGAGLGDIYQT